VESGHSAEELVAFLGDDNQGTYNTLWFDVDSDHMGHARVWCDQIQGFLDLYPCDLSYDTYGLSFKNWWEREVNWRIGGKLQVQDGLMLVADYQNSIDQYSYYGRHKNMKFINRLQATDLGAVTVYHERIPVNYGGTRNYFLLRDGLLLPWPDLTPTDG